MSFSFDYSYQTNDEKNRIEKDYKVTSNQDLYSDIKSIWCCPTNIEKNCYRIPIRDWQYFYSEFPNINHQKVDIKFTGKLFSHKNRDQTSVADQIIENLENNRSSLLSADTGFGKCLAEGTPILMTNGQTKKIEDIKIGDKVMGDYSDIKIVEEIHSGISPMYDIILQSRDLCTQSGEIPDNICEKFTVNKNHILTLYAVQQGRIDFRDNKYNVRWFDGYKFNYFYFYTLEGAKLLANFVKSQGSIFDIPLHKYLEYDPKIQKCLKTLITPVYYNEQTLPIPPGEIGRRIVEEDPSLVISNIYVSNSIENRLRLIMPIIQVSKIIKYTYPFSDEENTFDQIQKYEFVSKIAKHLYCVMNVARSLGFSSQVLKINEHCPFGQDEDSSTSKSRYKLIIKKSSGLYSFKIRYSGIDKYFGFSVGGNGRFVLGNYVVTHNSSIGTYITSKLGYKTTIICHLDSVRKHWIDEFKKFTSAKVQNITTKLDPNADVYLMGPRKALKFSMDQLSNIGFVIVDEGHMVTETTFTKTLPLFSPKYLLCLSATPDRKDGLHKLLHIYFGEEDDFVVRKYSKDDLTIIKCETNFIPEIEKIIIKGRLVTNWTLAKNSVEYNGSRQKYISNIALSEPNERFLILCDRNDSAKGIARMLGNESELLIGSTTKWDKSKRVLVAGMKKCGVGFDDPTRTRLILASDVTDVRQYVGRLRIPDGKVYDIVDNYSSFETHWKKRLKFYKSKEMNIQIRSEKKDVNKKKNAIPVFDED